MDVRSVPLGSVTIGPESWRESTMLAIRQAEHLVRQTHAGRLTTGSRPQSCSLYSKHATETTRDENNEKECAGGLDSLSNNNVSRPATTFLHGNRTANVAPFPASSMREKCADASVAITREYIRCVREIEGQLRKQASSVTREGTKLEKDRAYLEKMLNNIVCDLQVNQRSVTWRTKRPVNLGTERDGADYLLECERRELAELKQELEVTLQSTLSQLQAMGHCSKQLAQCASERGQVLALLPHCGSVSTGRSQTFTKADPTSPFTPECKQVLEASTLALSQSQQLRKNIRQKVASAISRQKGIHHTVNNGLVKKVAETINFQQSLTLSAAANKQAMHRKQREINYLHHSHERTQGPASSSDLLSREKLNRPQVQMYQRHPGTQLPEAAHLIEGSAVLRRQLVSNNGQLAQLQGTYEQLLDNLNGNTEAAKVDCSVVRMRRRLVDKRAMPPHFQQGAD